MTASESRARFVGLNAFNALCLLNCMTRFAQGIRTRRVNGLGCWSACLSFDAGGTRPATQSPVRTPAPGGQGRSLADAQKALDMMQGETAAQTLEALIGDNGIPDGA